MDFSEIDAVLQHFLQRSVDIIDIEFGHQYAKKNPALVSALASIGMEAYLRAPLLKNPKHIPCPKCFSDISTCDGNCP